MTIIRGAPGYILHIPESNERPPVCDECWEKLNIGKSNRVHPDCFEWLFANRSQKETNKILKMKMADRTS